jgi:hypothetical protein
MSVRDTGATKKGEQRREIPGAVPVIRHLVDRRQTHSVDRRQHARCGPWRQRREALAEAWTFCGEVCCPESDAGGRAGPVGTEMCVQNQGCAGGVRTLRLPRGTVIGQPACIQRPIRANQTQVARLLVIATRCGQRNTAPNSARNTAMTHGSHRLMTH